MKSQKIVTHPLTDMMTTLSFSTSRIDVIVVWLLYAAHRKVWVMACNFKRHYTRVKLTFTNIWEYWTRCQSWSFVCGSKYFCSCVSALKSVIGLRSHTFCIKWSFAFMLRRIYECMSPKWSSNNVVLNLQNSTSIPKNIYFGIW